MFALFILLNFISSKPVGTLVFIENYIKIYVKSEENKLDINAMPYEIESGVELRFEDEARGQILLNNGAVITVTPNTQVVFENMVNDAMMVKLRYGAIYVSEAPELNISARGISSVSNSGSFIFKYNRSKLTGTFYSLSSNFTIKHGWDGKSYSVKPNQVFNLSSYSGNKSVTELKPELKAEVLGLFEFDYVPGGKVIANNNLLNYDLSKDTLPQLRGNIDYIRRLVNIF